MEPRPGNGTLAAIDAHPVRWGLLCYLAGDLGGDDAAALRGDLDELRAVAATLDLPIAWQFDDASGTVREVGGMSSRSAALPCAALGPRDSASPETFADFLRWGLSVVAADQVVVALRGDGVRALYEHDPHEPRARFTICRDASAGSALTGAGLAAAIRAVLREPGTSRAALEGEPAPRIALLAIDTSYAQFLELAYELDGTVDVLLASQTLSPRDGWDYATLARGLRTALDDARGPLDARALGRVLVPLLFESVRADARTAYALSALDLVWLDEVAHAFDALCIGTIQSLGESLVWRARELLRVATDPGTDARRSAMRGRARDRASEAATPWSYDAGSFLAMFGEALDAVADVAAEHWLSNLLADGDTSDFAAQREPLWRELADVWKEPQRGAWRTALAGVDAVAIEAVGSALDDALAARLRRLTTQTQSPAPADAYDVTASARLAQRLPHVLPLLHPSRLVTFERTLATARTVRRLAAQARLAGLQLLGPAYAQSEAAKLAAAAENLTVRSQGSEAVFESDETARPLSPGLVIASRSSDPATRGWPRWSGVSLYRPPRLDDLMTTAYAEFAIHQRIHWSAMLGAANLIEEHPRALWRLASSLLSTGAAGTRRDVLRRLTGDDTVVTGLRNQFQAMVPARMLSLSLEPRLGTGDVTPWATESEPTRAYAEYLLRLEAVDGGAVVAEQRSRVHPALLARALEQLRALPQEGGVTGATVRKLRSIGASLAEDILQTLNGELERERTRARDAGEGEALHLQLQMPPSLMQYPWELMQQGGAWLGERFAIGRQVFMPAGVARRVPRRSQCKLRMLVIGDPIVQPSLGFAPLEGARHEALQVVACFERLRAELGDLIDFDRTRDAHVRSVLTADDLRQLLREGRYDIVHFAGHGRYGEDDPLESAWILSDGPLTALSFANTLREMPAPPWFVYGNACEAGMDGARGRYHAQVFGLASAFINHGVAAYLAPLFQVEDMLAQTIALHFYEQLVRERRTVGESLRRAKREARIATVPDDVADAQPLTGLGWASLVLYGDPSEELFQALAGSDRTNGASGAREQPRARAAVGRQIEARPALVADSGPTLLHAPDSELRRWIDTPSERATRASLRGALPTPVRDDDAGALELIDVDGVRRFVWKPAGSEPQRRGASLSDQGLPGSPFAALLRDRQFRAGLRTRQRGLVRVIGRWIVKRLTGRDTSLIDEYDRDQVAREGLLWVGADASLQRLPEVRDVRPARGKERVLLLVHGTFSNARSPVEALGPEFVRWAHERYGRVLAFDHWTLGKDPRENAVLLASQLETIEPELLGRRQIDIVAHSRGGLVARAFCELKPEHAAAVRKLVYVATPNCGTDLANPDNWGMAADMLINMSGLPFASLLGRLASLLARYAVQTAEKHIPGLLAQRPLSEAEADGTSFLAELQRPSPAMADVTQYAIASEFAAAPLTLSPARIAAALGDAVLDRFYRFANDLVVNTSHVWCMDRPRPADGARPGPLGSGLTPERTLLFGPPRLSMELPPGCRHEVMLNVYHNNLLQQPVTRERLKLWLTT